MGILQPVSGADDRFGSKLRKSHCEQMLSALPPLATVERTPQHFS